MENHVDPSFYVLLDVKQTATKKQIKAAYYRLIKKYHPDKNKGNEVVANENAQLLNLAYSILSNDAKRADYDELLREYAAKAVERERRRQYQKQNPPPKPKPAAPSATSSSRAVQTRSRSSKDESMLPKLVGLAAWALLSYALSDRKKRK